MCIGLLLRAKHKVSIRFFFLEKNWVLVKLIRTEGLISSLTFLSETIIRLLFELSKSLANQWAPPTVLLPASGSPLRAFLTSEPGPVAQPPDAGRLSSPAFDWLAGNCGSNTVDLTLLPASTFQIERLTLRRATFTCISVCCSMSSESSCDADAVRCNRTCSNRRPVFPPEPRLRLTRMHPLAGLPVQAPFPLHERQSGATEFS